MEKTLGRQRVNFQEKEPEHIRAVRIKVASLIDELEIYRGVKSDHRTAPENMERQRLISIAQTKLEEACMFAIKVLYAE